MGFLENDNIEGPAIIFSLKENYKDNNDENNKDDNKIIILEKGEIINKSIDDDEELIKIKKSKKYKEMYNLYENKLLPEYNKNEDYFKIEEDL